MRRTTLLISVLAVVVAGSLMVYASQINPLVTPVAVVRERVDSPTPRPSLTPTPALIQSPHSKILPGDYHTFQTFNNCGPAALSMTLSFYRINRTQQELGQALRPYQNPGGDNDDKSVTLEELAEKSKEYGFIPYHRPNGNIALMKAMIAYDMPVITRTWLKENEDIGHYRVVKGYDDTTGELIQDDSLQGKNLSYTYEQFAAIWRKFGYEYLVLVPQDRVYIVQQILGKDADETVAWTRAVVHAKEEANSNPNDLYNRFNLSVALYHIGEYQQSVDEFEQIERRLPFRTLWYQIEPIQAYYELGDYDRVFEITDRVLNYHNRAFSELYLIRGEIYRKQGNVSQAKKEFENAVRYNTSLESARKALASIQ